MKTNNQANIHCPIDLFPKQEDEINRLSQVVNLVQGAAQKAPYAQALIETVNVLLACKSYDENGLDCQLCRNFSQLRLKVYSLVVKAGHIDDRRQRSTGSNRRP
jgi:hypothetical protein